MYDKQHPLKTIRDIPVTKECYKRIKIISIERDITMQEVVKEILEKATEKSKPTVTELRNVEAKG